MSGYDGPSGVPSGVPASTPEGYISSQSQPSSKTKPPGKSVTYRGAWITRTAYETPALPLSYTAAACDLNGLACARLPEPGSVGEELQPMPTRCTHLPICAASLRHH